MNEISVSKILDSIAAISAQIVTSQESLEQIKNSLSDVSSYSKTLADYDSKIKNINHNKENNVLTTTTTSWSISVPNNLQNASKNINARIEYSCDQLDRLNIEINNSEEIALYIESQINDLGKNLSTTYLTQAFGSLSANIALDEYKAAANKFVSISDKNMKYWTDKPLQFQWDSKTGSYLILQEDSNGKLVGMGWTSRENVINYYSSLEKSIETGITATASDNSRISPSSWEKKDNGDIIYYFESDKTKFDVAKAVVNHKGETTFHYGKTSKLQTSTYYLDGTKELIYKSGKCEVNYKDRNDGLVKKVDYTNGYTEYIYNNNNDGLQKITTDKAGNGTAFYSNDTIKEVKNGKIVGEAKKNTFD